MKQGQFVLWALKQSLGIFFPIELIHWIVDLYARRLSWIYRHRNYLISVIDDQIQSTIEFPVTDHMTKIMEQQLINLNRIHVRQIGLCGATFFHLDQSGRLAEHPILGSQPSCQWVSGGSTGFSACLTGDGTLLMGGRNHHGQLGLGSTHLQLVATQSVDLSDVVKLKCGVDHVVALTGQGEVYTWERTTGFI